MTTEYYKNKDTTEVFADVKMDYINTQKKEMENREKDYPKDETKRRFTFEEIKEMYSTKNVESKK
jgi:hypothetical protein